jgi:hypothetical protein
LPQSYREKYTEFLKPRSPLSLQPVFVRPEYSYLDVSSRVKYNIAQTSLGIDDIKSLVLSAIQNFNFSNLEGFNKTLHFSKLVAAIDAAQNSIISNDTRIRVLKYVAINPVGFNNYNISYDMPILEGSLITDVFRYDGKDTVLQDDGAGKINVISDGVYQSEIGGIDYNSGRITIGDLNLQTKSTLKISVTPKEADIASNRRTILRVLDSDIKIDVEQVRI